MNETDTLIRSVEDALSSELDLYREIEALSERQMETLAKPSPDEEVVAQIMQAKHDLILRISDLEHQHAPLKDQYEQVRSSIPQEKKDKLQSLRDALDALLPKLLEMERQCEKQLKVCGENLEKQLRQLQTTRRARQAYNAYARQAVPPRFYDKKR